MTAIIGISDSWPATIDDKLTFCGTLVEYFDQIASRWNESTQTLYNKDYDKYVLPDVSDMPIAEYVREDYDRVLDGVKEKKDREGLVCNEKTIHHIRYIIKRVLEIAEKNGVCEDVLWGSEYSISETEDETALNVKEFVRLRKSLTFLEELENDKRLMHNYAQSGQRMGLALMYCLGLRNNEACGARFSSIKPMVTHPQCHCLWIYETTVLNSTGLQSGGKTRNAGRIVPVPEALLQLITDRRAFIMQKIRDGSFQVTAVDQVASASTDEEIADYVDTLPIACFNEQYNVSCSARHLTAAGTALFKEIAVDLKEEKDLENELALIDIDIRRPGRNEEGIDEKDPTAYLYRRNLGTLLYLLGLEEWEIQYILGHDVEDPNEVRSYFRNEEKLYPIYCKMAQRPIVNDITHEKEIVLDAWSQKENCVHSQKFRIPIDPSVSHYKLQLKQKEPLDPPRVSVCCENILVAGTCARYVNSDEFDRKMNIVEVYQQEYRRAVNKWKSANDK